MAVETLSKKVAREHGLSAMIEAPPSGGWQPARSRKVPVAYQVQGSWVIAVWVQDKTKVLARMVRGGEVFQTTDGLVYTLFLPAGSAVERTQLQFGSNTDEFRHWPTLETACHTLNEAQLLHLIPGTGQVVELEGLLPTDKDEPTGLDAYIAANISG